MHLKICYKNNDGMIFVIVVVIRIAAEGVAVVVVAAAGWFGENFFLKNASTADGWMGLTRAVSGWCLEFFK